jgi:hypothetical protein
MIVILHVVFHIGDEAAVHLAAYFVPSAKVFNAIQPFDQTIQSIDDRIQYRQWDLVADQFEHVLSVLLLKKPPAPQGTGGFGASTIPQS